MHYFQDLGEKVLERYKGTRFDPHSLPDIASAVLKNEPLKDLTYGNVLAWVRSTSEFPRQEDLQGAFGQPPITVYWHPEFYIAVLMWYSGTTTIHEHGFSGAFKVLEGASVHSRYTFEESLKIDSHLKIGKLSRIETNLLTREDCHSIYGGSSLIHSLFHLVQPSATIVIRTRRDPDIDTQLTYYPPNLGYRPYSNDKINPLFERRFQILDQPILRDPQEYLSIATEIINNSDENLGVRVLQHAIYSDIYESIVPDLIRNAAARHGNWVHDMIPSVQEGFRSHQVNQSRTYIEDPSQRFFLALLASYFNRNVILELMSKRFPETDPVEKIMELVPEMSGVDRVGIDFDEVNMDIFRLLLEGTPDEQVPAKLEEIYDPKEIEDQKEELKSHIKKMKESPVFKPLFL
jgi:hypothetical protein